ncbi:AraC family transcriptional regulator [Marinomonas sp. PE14-40]|uniref:AraC family transcriptional regulator n=1 Tax=Marinomonas sp. PE14-40 TaxID=3060621 RepID=UPI003F6738CC
MQIYKIETDENGRELTTHGASDFPCSSYDEVFSAFYGGEVPWHWHDEVEIVLVVRGRTKVECIGKSETLEAGEMIFVNAGALHKLTDVGEEDCRILNAVFNPQMLGGMNFSRIYKKHVLPVLKNKQLLSVKFSNQVIWQQAAINELKQAFQVWQDEREDYEFVMTMALMKFWHLFIDNKPDILSDTHVSSTNEKRLHTLLNYIHEHHSDSISIADISHAANISESECYRLFRNALKSTPNNYLLNYRLRMAAHLLVESDKPITKVAYDTGFNCPAYFAKKFKLAFEKTPKTFRQESRLDTH